MRTRGCEVDRKEGKTLQSSFYEGRALRSDACIARPMYPMQEFAGRDDRKEEFLILPAYKLVPEVQAPALGLDENACVDQDAHGSLSGV